MRQRCRHCTWRGVAYDGRGERVLLEVEEAAVQLENVALHLLVLLDDAIEALAKVGNSRRQPGGRLVDPAEALGGLVGRALMVQQGVVR